MDYTKQPPWTPQRIANGFGSYLTDIDGMPKGDRETVTVSRDLVKLACFALMFSNIELSLYLLEVRSPDSKTGSKLTIGKIKEVIKAIHES